MKNLNEMMKRGHALLLAGCVALTMVSCETETPDTPEDPASNPPTPSFEFGFGSLAAVKTVTTFDPGFGVPVQEIVLGLGSGGFTDGTDFTNFIDGGTVSLEGENLEKFSNNAYASQPSQTNPTGIDLSSNPVWVVSGAGEVPGFTHTTGIGFPTLGTITSATTIPATGDYVLTVSNISGADSVFFMLGGIAHTEPGNSTSSTFTEAEINTMGTGTNFMQIAPYKWEMAIYSGKNFYFVTEAVKTQSVTIE